MKALPSIDGSVVPFLIKKLRSHMPCSQKNQNIKGSNIVTNSIKTLEMVYIKKKSLLKNALMF